MEYQFQEFKYLDMSLRKINIIKDISKKTSISSNNASDIFEYFLQLIKIKSKLNIVKLSGFGSFRYKKTPRRIGRNPKTQDSYIIPELNKLNFSPSNMVKEKIN